MKLTQRMTDELFEKLKAAAEADGISINAVINQACKQYVENADRPTLEKRIAQLETKMEQEIFSRKMVTDVLKHDQKGTEGRLYNLEVRMESARERLDKLDPDEDEEEDEEK